MREYKFRVWDTFNETMITAENVFNIAFEINKNLHHAGRYEAYYDEERYPFADIYGPFDYFQAIAENDQFIVEQFTGLRDKNGKEIYEGDICYPFKRNKLRWVVEYQDGVFLTSYQNKVFALLKNWHTGITVIGNIHEPCAAS